MPYKDPERSRTAANERARRWYQRQRLLNPKCPPGKHGNHAKGERNGRWNRGKLISTDGYILVRVSKDHHRAFGGGGNLSHAYAYEHDLVMETKLGRPLAQVEVVHHDDEDKQNNDPDNLILKTRSAHMKHHDTLRGRDQLGRFPKDLQIREFPHSTP